MRWSPVTILVCWVCVLGLAQHARSQEARPGGPAGAGGQDLRRTLVAAANADALEHLQRDVMATTMVPDLTVKEFLAQAGGDDQLLKTLRRADRIGGPRFPSDDTCQVRLEIGGEPVAEALTRIAEANPDRLPMPPQALRQRMAGWKNRTFSATGTSTTAIERLDPAALNPRWRGVQEKTLREAYASARQDAARRVLQSIGDIPLPGGKTVAATLDVPAVRDEVEGWLVSRPVVDVEFGEDMEVRVTLSAPTEELWKVLRASIAAHLPGPLPDDPTAWEQARQAVSERVAKPIGRRAVPAERAVPAAGEVVVPAEPPQWAFEQATVTGKARGPQDLRTTRLATEVAKDLLRAKVEALPLTPNLTLGQAARKDPAVAKRVDRGLGRATASKVDYDPGEGTVQVRLSLDLRYVWRTLERPAR